MNKPPEPQKSSGHSQLEDNSLPPSTEELRESRFLNAAMPVLTGLFYAFIMHTIFNAFTPRGEEASGVMRSSFLIGVPFVVGLIVGYANWYEKKVPLWTSYLLTTLSILSFVFLMWVTLREGLICIVMALPLFLLVALAGVVLSSLFKGKDNKALFSFAALPLLMMSLEDRMDEPTRHQRINHSIEIAAPAEVIWHHINYPTNIQPDELKNGWAYRIGVPYPVSARTLDERVGGKRELQWQHGVKFQEVITKWQPTQHIAWRYEFEADSFPPDSLDDHIVIGGRYFQLNDTSYTLAPLPNGNTRLSISVGTSIRTSFNWYAEPWAKFLLSDTAQTILNFYKVRAELGK